jgi:sugar lactone lactonase YvrE
MEAIHLYPSQNILGEGPIWSVDEQALYWVDIDGKKIQRYSPSTKQYEATPMPIKVSLLAFRKAGGFVCGTENGLYFWHPGTLDFEPICNPEAGKKDARFNDGKVDRNGRLWAGTMTAQGASSSLYKLGEDLSLSRMVSEITISNGIGWSPDNTCMYYVDSLRYMINVFDFDIKNSTISNRRAFVRFEDGIGVPDGLTVDREGYVWVAVYDGWKVMRFDPSGKIDAEIKMPVSRPSSCAFGGKDMDELYITTISEGLSEAQKEEEPLAGDLFVVKTDTQGFAEPEFSG